VPDFPYICTVILYFGVLTPLQGGRGAKEQKRNKPPGGAKEQKRNTLPLRGRKQKELASFLTGRGKK
jgi:hypothetical protein